MRRAVVAAASGLLFGGGLMISGMASTENVLGFLTLGEGWNPSLLFVMGGALLVSLPGHLWLKRYRSAPWLHASFAKPAGAIDHRLLFGASLFGVGWGLAGFCPGPALVNLSLMQGAALVFVPAMLAGAWLAGRR
ncbi:MAG: DUF6691 family protein [Pseudomonadota bacterium]